MFIRHECNEIKNMAATEVMSLEEYRKTVLKQTSGLAKSRQAQSQRDRKTDDPNHPESKLAYFVETVFNGENVVRNLMPLKETTGRRFRLDVAVARLKVCFELDGYSHHGLSKKGFTKDRERDRLLMLAGWRVFRFTAKQINQDGYGTIEILKEIKVAANDWVKVT